MLVELCTWNYITLDGPINGVDGIFKDYTKTFPKSLIWIHFQNLQIGLNTKSENSQMYKKFLTFDKN